PGHPNIPHGRPRSQGKLCGPGRRKGPGAGARRMPPTPRTAGAKNKPSPTRPAGLVGGGGTARDRVRSSAAVPGEGRLVVAVAVLVVGVAGGLVAGRGRLVARQEALLAGDLIRHRGRRERRAGGSRRGQGRGGAGHGRVEAGGAGVHQRVVLWTH